MNKKLIKIGQAIKWLVGFILLILVFVTIHLLIEIHPAIIGIATLIFFIWIYYIYRKWKKKK